MKKINNIPPLRFPEFEGKWEKKKLGEVAKFYSGGTPLTSKRKYFGGNIPFIRSGEINSDKTEQFITEEGLKNSSAKMVNVGDILYALYGATSGEVGISKIKGAINQAVLCILSSQNHYFIYSVLKAKKESIINTYLQGGQGNLSSEIVKSIEISFPSLPEQTKIASFLTAVDERIQALKKKQILLEQYKKGVMQKLFSQEVRFTDEQGNDFPEWEVKSGGELFESISNKKHNSDLPILAISQEFGAVPRDLINYQISVTDKSVESYKVVEVGDFIISLRSFQGGIEYSKYRGICSPAYVILRNVKPINHTFFKYYFKTAGYIHKLCEKLEGIRDGKMVSYKYFSEIELPYPAIEEQARIAAFLTVLDEKIAGVGILIEKTEKWKRGLLQKMFV